MLPKPTPVRAMQFILYFKLALILIVVLISFLLFALPANLSGWWHDFRSSSLKSMFDIQNEIFTASHFGTVALNLSIPIGAMLLMLYFIQKRKQFPALITSFLVLWFSSNNQIQLMLSMVIILLFFLKSTRNYFRNHAHTIEPEPAETGEVDFVEAAEGEGQEVVQKLAPKSLVKKKEAEIHIREATAEDAETVYSLMRIAYEEYKTAIPPSSALEETEEAIAEALHSEQEHAMILFEEDSACAMIRYQYIDNAIFFFRLSVIPSKRRRGYARMLIKRIEKQGIAKGLDYSRCKVRQSIQNNLVLYQDMGYEVVDQELIVRPAGTLKSLLLEKKLKL